jgi:HK97 gp10 family phage protein
MHDEVAKEEDVVGQMMVDLAKQLVPVRTGFLQSTIMQEVDRDNITLTFGATAPYASFVEFGTIRMAARPYLRPAMDAHQQKLLDALVVGVLNAFR